MIVTWSAIGVAVLIVGVLVYGLVLDRFIKGHEPVARVNGVTITTDDLRGEVDFLQRFYMMPITAEYLDFVLDDILIREELVRQEVGRRGLVVTAEDVQREIEEEQGYYRDGTPTPTPTLPATSTPVATTALTATEALTPTPTLAPIPTSTPVTAEGFQQSYDQFLAMRDISDEEYRNYIRTQLMYEVLFEDFRKDVPATLDQVQLRYLRVTTAEQASELAGRLEAGASFETLKEEVELDEEAPGYGSDLQRYTQETLEQALGADIVDQAFGMTSGVFTQESQGMYYVVEVVDHGIRDVEDTLADQLANVALLEWIESQQESVEHLEYDPEYVLVDAPASSENPLMNP
ncbi:MAG: SurA N-terminal domain-containing protein [Anaerolineae bacterium]|nr:SurA N-terminal domain-containing protein [Anaerolineae bacterium]